MAEEASRSGQKVSCVCGAQLRVDTTKADRRVTCASCRNTFDFVVSVDAARKRSRVSIVLTRAAMKTEGDSLGKAGPTEEEEALFTPEPTPPPEVKPAKSRQPTEYKPKVNKVVKKVGGKTTRIVMGNCECGAEFPLEDTGELATLQSCPQCNTPYHVVFKIEHGTNQKTAMLVPEKPKLPKARSMTVKPGAPPLFPEGNPSPDDVRVTDFFTPAKKGRTRVSKASNTKVKPPKSKAPPEIPPGAQGVPCSCGTIFVVRRRDLIDGLTCEGCGKKASFEETRDPQSLAPVIRLRKS
jgi:hypothetical protein